LNKHARKFSRNWIQFCVPGRSCGRARQLGETGSGKKGEIKTPALKAFGRDLTEIARKGEMDPVIGRKNEIERVIQILCRRTKNNPVLLGEAGLERPQSWKVWPGDRCGNVPEFTSRQTCDHLDLALMVAGTKYRGQFEERIKAVMDGDSPLRKISFLFIDELHPLLGPLSEGTNGCLHIIKPALSRGELQCMAPLRLTEYRKYIEKDAALERRFQAVKVEAPSIEEAILIQRSSS